jgi:probable rRNA maturation factor
LVTFETDVRDANEGSLARFLGKARRIVGLPGQVNVLVTTNRQMRELNRRFRNNDKPTDVLSFPAPEGIGQKLAGDIAISAEIAGSNARALGHSSATELRLLVLHGLLHLAGYDHETDDGDMERRESRLRRELGLPESLIERAGRGVVSRGKVEPSPARRKNAGPLTKTKACFVNVAGSKSRSFTPAATEPKAGAKNHVAASAQDDTVCETGSSRARRSQR